jgi:hypothetical protein
MVYIGPVMTLRKLNSAKPGDPPSTNRVALYNPSPEEIANRSEAMVKEYEENLKKELKKGKKQDGEKQEQNDEEGEMDEREKTQAEETEA